MRISLFFLLIAFPFIQHEKGTKKITKINYYPNLKEVFYVLKSDDSVRHGSYKAEALGKTIVEGHFRMGVMDSIWTQYDLTGAIRSRGWIENNKRDSIWEFFDTKGKLEQKIDYTNNVVLLYHSPLTQNPFRIISGSDTIMSVLDRPPLYIGGTSRLNDYLKEEIRIPLHKPTETINGVVYLGFTIDSLGKTSNHRVLKGFGRACNDEALRVLKTLPEQWIPGGLKGKNVTIDYILPVRFDSTNLETTILQEN